MLNFKQVAVKIPDEDQGAVASGDLGYINVKFGAFFKESFLVVDFDGDMRNRIGAALRIFGNENLKMDSFARIVDHPQFIIDVENGPGKGRRQDFRFQLFQTQQILVESI